MSLPIPSQPWVNVSMDFVLSLPRAQQGVDSIFVVVDHFFKMAHFIPCKKTTNAVVIEQFFFKKVYCLHGLLASIVFDRDTQFLSHFCQTLWKMVGTKLNFNSVYHPQTNECLVGEHLKSWDQKLSQAEFAHNYAINCSTGRSPFGNLLGVYLLLFFVCVC